MIEPYRSRFNQAFSTEKYAALRKDIADDFAYEPTFRIAESPFFIGDTLKEQLIEASQQVIDFIRRPDFKTLTQKAITLNTPVPNEDEHTTFLAIDFGICEENGQVIPKLIEVQGFPSLFHFQQVLYGKFKKQYDFLEELTPYFNGISEQDYAQIVQEAIVNGHEKENVILLEIEPEKQNTKIDFYYCRRHLGIPVVCVTELLKKGKQLFYRNKQGQEIQVKRIYNRVIFDELELKKNIQLNFSFSDDLEVEWAGHPNWFFRISKFILPLLQGPYFIETTLLSELKEIPTDLENYVLKPLFSFSGSGVIFHVTRQDIEAVQEKDLYILQKKVLYKPILQAPDGKVKVEVRVLCVWPKAADAPSLLCNLVRLSRGEMIGVKFNKDKDWVGGSVGLFKK